MKKINLLVIIFVLMGCNSKNKYNNIEKISIDIKDDFFDSSIFSSVDLIEIKGNPIGRIRKFNVINKNFVFSVNSGKDRVYLYNVEKQKLKPIKRKGNGPFEITGVSDLRIDSKNHIQILDMMKKRAYVLDRNGENENKIIFSDFFDEVIINNKKAIGFKKVSYKSKNDYKISILKERNKKFIFNKGFLQMSSNIYERDFAQTNSIYSYKDSVRFVQPFSDTIYSVNEKSITPRYLINFGNKKLPYKLFNDKNLDLIKFVDKVRKSDYIWNINTVFENSNYIFLAFRYSSERRIYFSMYNKNNKKTMTSNKLNLMNFLGIKNIPLNEEFYPVFMNEDSMYFVVEPYFFNGKNKEFLKINKMLNKSDYENNPFILKFNFLKK